MVDPFCYSTDYRRYSRTGSLLPASPAARHRYPLSLLDSRPPSRMMNEQAPEVEQQPRKRIAVACGRCRKRKIRCSGDPGNGEPCTNCRSANVEPCQFLRVASQEASLLHDRGPFSYDVETARNHHVRSATSSPFSSPQFAHEMPEALPVARYPTPSSTYPYAARYYPGSTAWPGTYPEEVDLSLSAYGAGCYAQENPFAFRFAGRPPAGSHMYGEATGGYPVIHRPAVETSSMSLSSVAAALPPTIAGNERMLPSLCNKGIATSVFHGDSVASYGIKSAHSSPDGSPTESVHDVPGHYGTYDSPPASAFTHAASLGSTHRESPSAGCGSEAYSSSSTGGAGSLYSDTEPNVRSLGGFSLRSGHSSRRESEYTLTSTTSAYTLAPGPIPAPSIAGRGLHQAQAAAAAASAAYRIPGGSSTTNTSDPTASAQDQDGNDTSATIHPEAQRVRVTASLSAA